MRTARLRLAAVTAAVSALALVGTGPAAAASAAPADRTTTAACSPVSTTPRYRGQVPSPERVLGFPFGAKEATGAQLNRYLDVVDRSSARVVSGTFAHTVTGRPLRYALLGRPANLTRAALARTSADAQALRDPRLSPARAARIEARMPVILWLTGNVHGNEPAAGDAIEQLAYELADRSDCVATSILDHALVGIIPSQNPDGRAADTRENAYAFDMNRDWFARTQPETSGKLDLLRRFPPQLYIDEHGMGGKGYFFPPNADPIYHETPDRSVDWFDHLYGPANARSFDQVGYSYETYQAGYDLLYQGYGDSVPTTRFGAAGMTYEVGQGATYAQQTAKHRLSGLTSLYTGATHRASILHGYHRTYVQARAQGERCSLQPNQVYNPGSTVERPVPKLKVCGYLLRTGSRAKARALATVVRRLQQADVRVYATTRPVRVPDYTPYGRAGRATTLPRGTYWIPMAQAQKHWVQAMLNEDTYVPFPYFYDVSGWSMPLLNNLRGGYTGTTLRARDLRRLPLQGVPAFRAGRTPRIGLVDPTSTDGYPSESAGWLRWRLQRDWRVPATVLTPKQVTAGSLAKLDVLLVPDADPKALAKGLGAAGGKALTQWVAGGGHYVGWQGGTALAARLGLTTATLTDPASDVPGTLFRVTAAGHPALTRGTGATNEVMYEYDAVMRASDPKDVVLRFPSPSSPDWYVSGYQRGAAELGGTAAEVHERAGRGAVTVFSVEPNFRAFTDGTAAGLWDAIASTPRRTTVATAALGADARRTAAARSAAALTSYRAPGADAVVTVRTADAAATAAALRGHGAAVTTLRGARTTTYVVDLPGPRVGAPAWVRALPRTLAASGVRPLAVRTS